MKGNYYINLTIVNVKNFKIISYIVWNITLSNTLKVNRRFWGTYNHLQGQSVSQARHQHEAR
jgi:hypothetical protein